MEEKSRDHTHKKPLKGILRNSSSSSFFEKTQPNRFPRNQDYKSVPVRESYDSARIHVDNGIRHLGIGKPTVVEDVKFKARFVSPRYDDLRDSHYSPRRERRSPRRSARYD